MNAVLGTADNTEDLDTWVRLAQEGDRSAFEQVVQRTHLLVRKAAYPLVALHQVDDAVQETYLIVFHKLHHLKSPPAFRGWLVRIAVSVCRELRRKEGPAQAELSDVAGGDATASSVEAKLDITQALGQLKDSDRATVLMRDLLGLSYREIAYACRLPLGTVRSKIHYARGRLRELLGRDEPTRRLDE